MVVDQRRAGIGTGEQSWQHRTCDEEISSSRRLSLIPACSLCTPSDPPAIQTNNEDSIVHEGMTDGDSDTGDHVALLLASGILLPRATVLLDHADELNITGHDSGDGSEQACTKKKVGELGHVEEGGGVVEAGGEEGRLDVGGCEEVEDVEAPGGHVEGDGEMDESWVDWVAVTCG